MEILNRLNHTSIVRLLDHDAPNMRLELEYGGRDLHKFANDQKMSQLSEEAASISNLETFLSARTAEPKFAILDTLCDLR